MTLDVSNREDTVSTLFIGREGTVSTLFIGREDTVSTLFIGREDTVSTVVGAQDQSTIIKHEEIEEDVMPYSTIESSAMRCSRAQYSTIQLSAV
jgi:hypothetical protein